MSTTENNKTSNNSTSAVFAICQWHYYTKEDDVSIVEIIEYNSLNKKEKLECALKDCQAFARKARMFWMESTKLSKTMLATQPWNPTISLKFPIDVKYEFNKSNIFEKDTVLFQVFDIPTGTETLSDNSFLIVEYSTILGKPMKFYWTNDIKSATINHDKQKKTKSILHAINSLFSFQKSTIPTEWKESNSFSTFYLDY